MSIPVPSVCAPIAAEVRQLEAAIRALQDELKTAPPSEKPIIIEQIKEAKKKLGKKKRELLECQRANLPDLFAYSVTIEIDHTERTICVAGIIRNIGGVDVSGPFKVAIGIAVRKGGVLISTQEIFDVPESVTIEADGGEYTTECSQMELIYRDEDPGAVYGLEVLADVEKVIAEFNEGNNHFIIKWWTISPSAAKKVTPFKIESQAKL